MNYPNKWSVVGYCRWSLLIVKKIKLLASLSVVY
ncbi:Uncharacterised protein [Serratia proteamaculans]|jgi:hypothetical protein|nr:Uncharacterised protein [Serratia proteamaculans]